MTLPTDLQTLVICSGVLYLKFQVTALIQAQKSFAAGKRAPEDKVLPMAKALSPDLKLNFLGVPKHSKTESSTLLDTAIDEDARWRRIIQNDMETIPLALVVFIIASLVENNHRGLNALCIAFFTVTRILHTIAYAKKQATTRSLLWTFGTTAVLAIAVLAIFSSF